MTSKISANFSGRNFSQNCARSLLMATKRVCFTVNLVLGIMCDLEKTHNLKQNHRSCVLYNNSTMEK